MGRPRNFDEQRALRSAMECFWERGYEGASIGDLAAATGASRASLYTVWGDKGGLYRAALQHYADTVASEALDALQGEDPLGAIRAYVARIGELVASGHSCFVVDTVMNPACADVFSDLTRAQLDRVENALLAALEQANVPGAPDHARHLAVSLQGLLVQGRARPPRATIDAFVRITLATLPESPCSSSS